MQCIETTLGAETYFALITLLVGGLVNLVKRIKFVPGDAVPVVAFTLGWAIDGAASNGTCGVSYTEAAMTGLGGGFAGLAAAGGHEALSRMASAFGLGALADKLLGRAKATHDDRIDKPKTKPPTITAGLLLCVLVCAPMLVSCDGALGTAAKVAHAAGNALDILDGLSSKSQAYFDRHPSLDNNAAVTDLIKQVREAVEGEEREKAVELYRDLRELLDGLGIPAAKPPMGGAETDAPMPEPFEVPTVEDFEASL